jgi:hypothetical protein
MIFKLGGGENCNFRGVVSGMAKGFLSNLFEPKGLLHHTDHGSRQTPEKCTLYPKSSGLVCVASCDTVLEVVCRPRFDPVERVPCVVGRRTQDYSN